MGLKKVDLDVKFSAKVKQDRSTYWFLEDCIVILFVFVIVQPLSMGLVRSPVWTELNWALATVARAREESEGKQVRMSTDISVSTVGGLT